MNNGHSSSPESVSSSSSSDSSSAIVSGTWTKYLPQALGIREMFETTPFRWCAREVQNTFLKIPTNESRSFMWGIATGTTMGLHRLRMGSKPKFALNISFLTFNLVAIPSYYFCYRKREHKEEMIELMMKANDFAPLEEMPPSIPLTDHPFLSNEHQETGGEVIGKDMTIEQGYPSYPSTTLVEDASMQQQQQVSQPIPTKQYRGWLKEFKEWQQKPRKQQVASDAEHVFQEVVYPEDKKQ